MATKYILPKDPSRQLTRSIGFDRKPVYYGPGLYELVAAALMWAIVFIAIVVIVGCSPAHAGDRIPREFQGDWCVAGDANDDKVTEYRRGRCANPDSDGVLKITRGGFEEVESGCKLRRIVTASRRGLWIGAFKCGGEGNAWTATYAISINPRTDRLTLTIVQRSEDKPEGAR